LQLQTLQLQGFGWPRRQFGGLLFFQLVTGFVSASTTPAHTADPAASVRLRMPRLSDGSRMRQLVVDSGVLDENSCYLYLLLARDFATTCVVAERSGGELVGFVSAYRRPRDPESLFVWQIGVAESARRQGLARRMLDHVLDRDACRSVRYLEATVSDDNHASRRLFQSLARDRGAPLKWESGFAAELFGAAGHPSEPLLRTGPLASVP
jgi:L-2,4-diaminobutyric acid acetyltransferase